MTDDLIGIATTELRDRSGLAADEGVQLRVVEQPRHLSGVRDAQGLEPKTFAGQWRHR
jgi:hypothetical protein